MVSNEEISQRLRNKIEGKSLNAIWSAINVEDTTNYSQRNPGKNLI